MQAAVAFSGYVHEPMNHFTTPEFWQHYNALPQEVQVLADRNYALLKTDPGHRSLKFKNIEGLWSVRVGLHYRGHVGGRGLPSFRSSKSKSIWNTTRTRSSPVHAGLSGAIGRTAFGPGATGSVKARSLNCRFICTKNQNARKWSRH
jgi:hypothetical protein